ncbi:MAG: hypothetical protein R2746_13335 [Acidimicrobiales bacterium]
MGDRVPVEVETRRSLRRPEIRTLDPTGPWTRAEAPASGAWSWPTGGLFHALRVEVRVTAPLGILAAHKVHWIGRSPHAVGWPPPAADAGGRRSRHPSAGAHHVTAPTRRAIVRSVRPYVSGDPPPPRPLAHHGPHGQLVVRERSSRRPRWARRWWST